jgi:nitrate reductase delta subunit
MSSEHPYSLFARLLGYPREDLLDVAERCQALVAERNPEAAETLDGFLRALRGRSLSELEELYARAFDLNQTRCMDLGYQIFGETYKRGSFLVKMKDAVRRYDIDAGSELPDHLSVVLRLLPALSPDDDPVELASEVMLPVIDKLLRTFEDDEGGYRSLFRALEQLMMSELGIREIAPLPLPNPVEGGSGGRKLPMFPGFNPPTESPRP